MLDMIHYKKFPFTELQGILPCSEKSSRNSCHKSNTFNPNLPSHFINTDFCITFKSEWGNRVSTVSLQLNENQSFISGSKVARADSLTIHICLEPSLKISGAIPPLNLFISMAHNGTNVLYLCLLPMYISILSGPIKKPFYKLLTSYMHTTWPISFIFIDPITLNYTKFQ